MDKLKSLNICVITPASNIIGHPGISNLIDVLVPSFNELHLIMANGKMISADNIKLESTIIPQKNKTICRVLNYIVMQIKITLSVIKILNSIDLWIFFSGEGLILPLILLKVFNRKIVLILAGSLKKESAAKRDITFKILDMISHLSFYLTDYIILYSNSLISNWDLERYRDKILIASKHFVDYNIFSIKKEISSRNCIVGYVGRLSEEKGIMNLVKAIPDIIKLSNDINFVIAGDGILYNDIKKFIYNNNLNERVHLAGWIPNHNLPQFLNELKLLVLPSFDEGLPNIMIESMACGVPVLAMPVGAISDVIRDEECGFLMETNSPECIRKNIIRALIYPDLERLVTNARERIKRDFTFEKSTKRYKQIISFIFFKS